MPTFSYQAIDADGHEVAGTLEARGLGAAIDKIRMLGLFPGSVNEDSANGDSTSRFFGMLAGLRFGKRSRDARVAIFTRELADLLAGGVPLSLSLTILRDRQKPGGLKNVLRELAQDVEAGAELSDALDKQRKTFGDFPPQIVRQGEKSGRLKEALEDLADFKQRQWAHARAMRKSLGRPVLLLVFGLALFIYLFVILFPALTGSTGIFPSYWWHRRRLTPWSVSVTLVFVGAFKSYFLTVAVGGIVFMAARLLLLKVRIVRALRDAAVLRLPFFRKSARALAASQLARPFSALISLGASFPDALKGARHAIDNQSAAKAVGEMALDLEEGEALEDSAGRLGWLSPVAVHLLGKAGVADDPIEILRNAADDCDDRLDATIEARSRAFTSVLLGMFIWLALWLILLIILLNVSSY